MAGEMAKFWSTAKSKALAAAGSDAAMKKAMGALQDSFKKGLGAALDKLEATSAKDKFESQKAKIESICEGYATAVSKAIKAGPLTRKEAKPLLDALQTGRQVGIGAYIDRKRVSVVNNVLNAGFPYFNSSDAKLSGKWFMKAVNSQYQRGTYDDLKMSLIMVDHFAAGRGNYTQSEYDSLKANFAKYASEVTSRNPDATSGKAVTKLRKLVDAFANVVAKHVAKSQKANDKQEETVLGAVNDKVSALNAFRKSILTVENVINDGNESAAALMAEQKKAVRAEDQAKVKAAKDALAAKITKAIAASDKLVGKIPSLAKVEKLIEKVYTDKYVKLPTTIAKAKSAADAAVANCEKALADIKSVGTQVIGKLT